MFDGLKSKMAGWSDSVENYRGSARDVLEKAEEKENFLKGLINGDLEDYRNPYSDTKTETNENDSNQYYNAILKPQQNPVDGELAGDAVKQSLYSMTQQGGIGEYQSKSFEDMWLKVTIPKDKVSTFFREVNYTKEPFNSLSGGEYHTEYMAVKPLIISMKGKVSIQEHNEYRPIDIKPNRSLLNSLIKTAVPLAKMGLNMATMQLKYKFCKIYNNIQTGITALGQLQGYAENILGPDIEGIHKRNEESGGPKDVDDGLSGGKITKNRTQAYLLIFDYLARNGFLFDVNFCGVTYQNMAITRLVLVQGDKTQNSAFDVDMTLEQQPLINSATNYSLKKPDTGPKKKGGSDYQRGYDNCLRDQQQQQQGPKTLKKTLGELGIKTTFF